MARPHVQKNIRKEKAQKPKQPFRFGIRIKLMLQLLVLFVVGLTVINLLVFLQIRQSNETRIAADMRELLANSKIYTRQVLMLNQQNNEEEGFQAIASDLLSQLRTATGREAAAYTVDGTLLQKTSDDALSGSDADLINAMNGTPSYSLTYTKKNGLDVQFSCPMVVEEKSVGILRFYADYSDMARQGRNTQLLVFWVTFAVSLITFLLILVFANRIVRPVQTLARDSDSVARRIGSEAGGEISNDVDALTGRRDEIGELALNYRKMLTKINEQFRLLQEDADHIRSLYEYDRTFFNNVTHELKTPLTTIQGYAELLQSDARTDEAFYQKAVGHIEAESRRLHEMVVHLLDIAALNQKLPFEKVDLAALTVSVTEAMSLKARRYGNTFALSGFSSLPGHPGRFVRGQKERLRELLINLLDNAIKYGKENTPIAVVLDSTETQVFFSVENAGEGIPPDQLDKLCIPFYRINKQRSRERGSSGLGLSICQKIVEEHGGNITIQSQLQESVTVTVTLPRWEELSPESEKAAAEKKPGKGGTGRISADKEVPEKTRQNQTGGKE